MNLRGDLGVFSDDGVRRQFGKQMIGTLRWPLRRRLAECSSGYLSVQARSVASPWTAVQLPALHKHYKMKLHGGRGLFSFWKTSYWEREGAVQLFPVQSLRELCRVFR